MKSLNKYLKSSKKRLTKRKNQPKKRNGGGFLSRHNAKKTWRNFLIKSGLKEKPIVGPGEFGQRNTLNYKEEKLPEKSAIQDIPTETQEKDMRVETKTTPSVFYLGGFN